MLLVITVACKEQYMPPVLTLNRNYLVVDGTIITNSDSTIIKLSRTVSITDTILPAPETAAQVAIVGEGNDVHQLAENGAGRYVSAGLNLNAGQKYKLTIVTSDGSKYESDFVEAKLSPPIDSISWYQDDKFNLNIVAATHDPANNARYYRYEYTETWQYQSKFLSLVDWVDSQPVLRQPGQQVFYCWSTQNSSNVVINSTAKLSQDIATKVPITQIENGSERIGYKYSILVKQYCLTKDAYTFWDELKKNTENLGTLFDPQPTQIPTNLRCTTDPSKAVVGYISASSVQSTRIFISRFDLALWNFHPYYDAYQDYCEEKYVSPDSMNYFFPAMGVRRYVFIGKQLGTNKYIIMFLACADCREHGGINIKPPFWP